MITRTGWEKTKRRFDGQHFDHSEPVFKVITSVESLIRSLMVLKLIVWI